MALLEKAISKLFSPADRDDFVVLLFEGVFRLSRELRDEKVLGFSNKFLQLLPLFGKRSRTVAEVIQNRTEVFSGGGAFKGREWGGSGVRCLVRCLVRG